MPRYYDPEMLETAGPSTCRKFLRYLWKTITCLFSHTTLLSLVSTYCICGAFIFESLEKEHEKEVSCSWILLSPFSFHFSFFFGLIYL